MQQIAKAIISVVALLLFTQCRMAECTVVMEDVDINNWCNEVSVSYTNNDTEHNYDLSLVLHVNRRFAAKQLDVEIVTMTPDSLRYSERISLPVNFVWDNPTMPMKDVAIPYRQDVHLRCKGEYKVTITPLNDVVGVAAAGINFQPQK